MVRIRREAAIWTGLGAVVVVASTILLMVDFPARIDDDDVVPTPGSPADIVGSAYDKTVEMQTASVELDGDLVVDNSSINLEASGEVDLAGRQTRLTTTVQGPRAIEALGTTELVFGAGPWVFIRSELYASMREVKDWVYVDRRSWGGLGPANDVPIYVAKNDAIAWLHMLRGADDVEDLGPHDLEGVPTTRYRFSVDLREAGNRLSSKDENVGSTMFRMATWGDRDGVDCEIWIDAEGRVRRQRMAYGYDEGPVQGDKIDMTLTLSDFGTAFEIDLPPRAEMPDALFLGRSV